MLFYTYWLIIITYNIVNFCFCFLKFISYNLWSILQKSHSISFEIATLNIIIFCFHYCILILHLSICILIILFCLMLLSILQLYQSHRINNYYHIQSKMSKTTWIVAYCHGNIWYTIRFFIVCCCGWYDQKKETKKIKNKTKKCYD